MGGCLLEVAGGHVGGGPGGGSVTEGHGGVGEVEVGEGDVQDAADGGEDAVEGRLSGTQVHELGARLEPGGGDGTGERGVLRHIEGHQVLAGREVGRQGGESVARDIEGDGVGCSDVGHIQGSGELVVDGADSQLGGVAGGGRKDVGGGEVAAELIVIQNDSGVLDLVGKVGGDSSGQGVVAEVGQEDLGVGGIEGEGLQESVSDSSLNAVLGNVEGQVLQTSSEIGQQARRQGTRDIIVGEGEGEVDQVSVGGQSCGQASGDGVVVEEGRDAGNGGIGGANEVASNSSGEAVRVESPDDGLQLGQGSGGDGAQ